MKFTDAEQISVWFNNLRMWSLSGGTMNHVDHAYIIKSDIAYQMGSFLMIV